MQRSPKRRIQWRAYVDPLMVFVVFAILWELAVDVFDIKPYLLPTLSSVLQSMWDNRANLLLQSWITTQEVLFGFVGAVVTGVLLGAVIHSWSFVRRTIYPFVVVFQGIPKIALAPLMIIWFGYGDISKILMAFLFAFFPVVIATMGGLAATPSNLIEHFRAIRAPGWVMFRRLYVPSALPSIMDGCKQAMPLAVIGAIVGEFVGSEHGLGHLILNTTANARTDYLFAALITVSALAALLYLVIELVAKRVWWRGL
ncbi:ABC transporter permease [Pusillimonas noertemannii]|uniref:NitT/TauT family transport system permease protein n=1 Tax=Pusillimonas noertemannii TaxID=305977 RepID=A0A2U1CH50_9BURK|nr:ABC transporter permease [Pusillimonas noertemannii]NYT70616.1 ABC transporter permease [Pusillimonas noertemannii]PVY60225.1 NitT/TauT family transport system permease protein [Pusillimonas noertemannii]TFL07987.1 ABC transporter permease [Pusillimonas noertemannii]